MTGSQPPSPEDGTVDKTHKQEDKITITNSKSERNNVNLKKGNDKIQRNKQVRLGRKKTVKCDNSNKISEKWTLKDQRQKEIKIKRMMKR